MIKIPFRRPHIDDEQLSCFIDGTCLEQERIEIARHLERCDRCFEAYSEAVMYKGLWMSGASDLESSKESLGLVSGDLSRRTRPWTLDIGGKTIRFSSIANEHLRHILPLHPYR
jgi:hypothetical protein